MYKDADADWFHFSSSGFSVTPYGWDTLNIEVYWNVVTKAGTLNYLVGSGFKRIITPVEISCKTIEMPSMPSPP